MICKDVFSFLANMDGLELIACNETTSRLSTFLTNAARCACPEPYSSPKLWCRVGFQGRSCFPAA